MKRPEKYRIGDIGDKRVEDIEVYFPSDIDPLLDRLDELEAEEIRRNTYPNKVGREAIRVTADDKWCFNPVQADKKPFPSYEEFYNSFYKHKINITAMDIYSYMSQFQYEKTVFPKVGDMVEGEDDISTYRGKFKWIELDSGYFIWNNIRPVTRPTREEVIAKYGLTDSDLKALGVSNDLRTWIIENAEDVTGQDGVKWNAIDRDEILNYLKGQDDE